jgi:hypothetical protein
MQIKYTVDGFCDNYAYDFSIFRLSFSTTKERYKKASKDGVDTFTLRRMETIDEIKTS